MATAMQWQPSPCKRVLLELADFAYLFGNTGYASALADTGEATNRVLLLGFGDPRNAWATAGACAEQRSPACQELVIDLVDVRPANVARGVLLDRLATTLDLDLPEDLQFLWGVMYCSKLRAAWLPRLQGIIASLLENASGWRARFGSDADAAAATIALRAWAAPPPALATVLAERTKHIARWLEAKGAYSPQEMPFQKSLERYGKQLAASAVRSTSQYHPVATAEVNAYLKEGSIYPLDVEAAGGGNEGWVVNPTLLDPASGRWTLHYGSCPFLGYGLLDGGGGKRAVTLACQDLLRRLVSGRRRCTRARLVFHCADALGLMASGALPSAAYSSIDTSNLTDHLGLLSLLALCQPLLLRSPRARLHTDTMIWATSRARNLSEFIGMALGGADLRMLPTLLGLRLLRDPKYGRERPADIMAHYVRAGVSDSFVWAPAEGQVLMPSLAGAPKSNALLAGLRAIASVCVDTHTAASSSGEQDRAWEQDRTGLRFATTLTLLHVLRGMVRRATGVLPEAVTVVGAPWWSQVADHTAALCDVPPDLRHQWEALCCWCFGSGKSDAEAPLLASWKVTPTPVFSELLAKRAHTPVLVGRLATRRKDVELEISQAMQRGGPAGLAAAMKKLDGTPGLEAISDLHQLDVVGFDCGSKQMCCILPPGLVDNTSMLLAYDTSDPTRLLPLNAIPHIVGDGRTLSRFPLPPPAALEAGGWASDARRAAEAAAAATRLVGGLRVASVAEGVDAFHVALDLEGGGGRRSPSGPACELVGSARGIRAAHSVKVKLATPAASAVLPLPWPVTDSGPRYKTRLVPGSGRLELSLPKAWVWPQDREAAEPVVLEGLERLHSLDALDSKEMGAMFSMEEMQHRADTSRMRVKPNVMFDVRETVQVLFVLSLQRGVEGKMAHSLGQSGQKEAELSILVHGVLRLPDGHPIVHLSYVDHAVAAQLYPTPAQAFTAAQRFQRILLKNAGTVGVNNIAADKAEVNEFRQLLASNALRLRPPRWQQELLGEDSEWVPSFVLPLYSDAVPRKKELASFFEGAEKLQFATGLNLVSTGTPAPTPCLDRCSSCGTARAALRCSRCKSVTYCDRDCQVAHWKLHKPHCKSVAAPAAAAPQPPADPPRRCSACDQAAERLLKCSRCQQARYCNPQCQAAHWPTHRKECKQLSK